MDKGDLRKELLTKFRPQEILLVFLISLLFAQNMSRSSPYYKLSEIIVGKLLVSSSYRSKQKSEHRKESWFPL